MCHLLVWKGSERTEISGLERRSDFIIAYYVIVDSSSSVFRVYYQSRTRNNRRTFCYPQPTVTISMCLVICHGIYRIVIIKFPVQILTAQMCALSILHSESELFQAKTVVITLNTWKICTQCDFYGMLKFAKLLAPKSSIQSHSVQSPWHK